MKITIIIILHAALVFWFDLIKIRFQVVFCSLKQFPLSLSCLDILENLQEKLRVACSHVTKIGLVPVTPVDN